jgi:hypothetical protein
MVENPLQILGKVVSCAVAALRDYVSITHNMDKKYCKQVSKQIFHIARRIASWVSIVCPEGRKKLFTQNGKKQVLLKFWLPANVELDDSFDQDA